MNIIQELPFARLAALLPNYSTSGDVTRLITSDGITHTIDYRLRTVIRQLARRRATDLTALKIHTARATHRTILQPLPLAPELVLFPVKVRTPRVAGDPVIGYISLQHVMAVTPSQTPGASAVIRLTGGTAVPALWTPATIQNHMHTACLASSYTPGRSPALRETAGIYEPGLYTIAQKLVEVFQDILALKQGHSL